MSGFDSIVPITIREEGGFANNPNDPGGATNMGITRATLSRWRKCACSAQDVRELQRPEAEAIYEAWYWNTINGDKLPLSVALLVFDHGVIAGEVTSAKLLQGVVVVQQDGHIGPVTLAAVDRLGARDVTTRLVAWQSNDFRKKADFHLFGHEWLARLTRMETIAMTWLLNHPLIVPPVVLQHTAEAVVFDTPADHRITS